MEEDNTSTDAVDTTTDEQPAQDPILATLTDTEDSTPPSDDDVDETADDSEEGTETETESEVEQPKDEEPEETADESGEIDPKEEARRRYEERQQAIAEREDRIREQAKEYIEASEDEYDQRLRAMEVENFTRTVQNNENILITEFERVKANPDLQIFNPDNKDVFNEKAYDKALRDYNAGYVEYDQHGNMTRIKGSLFEHLTETADLLKSAINTGAIQQVRATNKMKSNADPKPASPPKESNTDPILDILKSDD